MCYNKMLHKIFDYIDVKIDEELPINKKKTCFINTLYQQNNEERKNMLKMWRKQRPIRKNPQGMYKSTILKSNYW